MLMQSLFSWGCVGLGEVEGKKQLMIYKAGIKLLFKKKKKKKKKISKV